MGALFFEISCKDEGFVENCFLKAVECYIVRNKLFWLELLCIIVFSYMIEQMYTYSGINIIEYDICA